MLEKLFGRNKSEDTANEVVDVVNANETTAPEEVKDTVVEESVKEVFGDVIKDPVEEHHQPPPLTRREMTYLKKSNYQEKIMNNPMFKQSYVLLNKRTGQIAEIRAASSFHACNIIGWKANHVHVLQENKIQEKQENTEETMASSSK